MKFSVFGRTSKKLRETSNNFREKFQKNRQGILEIFRGALENLSKGASTPNRAPSMRYNFGSRLIFRGYSWGGAVPVGCIIYTNFELWNLSAAVCRLISQYIFWIVKCKSPVLIVRAISSWLDRPKGNSTVSEGQNCILKYLSDIRNARVLNFKCYKRLK